MGGVRKSGRWRGERRRRMKYRRRSSSLYLLQRELEWM